ncbi:2Fe-2S ferredoxin-type domain-containing protein [Dichomitus squalens]|uniref:2Fe-2S ferredoxin-type domain-containing protein n=1 Tax=Dichomitus squalens TaxID=114155 RepID=A0A4Q9M4Y5_9APHY|nr:2Fe-2S ferredoxin-type domain-containing protein [Dichomitus squalens]
MSSLAHLLARSCTRQSASSRAASYQSRTAHASCSYTCNTPAPYHSAQPRPPSRPSVGPRAGQCRFLYQARGFHSTNIARHGGIHRPEPGTGIKVHFKDSKGNHLKTVEANEGDDILAIAHEYDIDLEGACEGSVACSTCHVILDLDSYDKLPEPEDDENDMLDMAFGLTDTSRLGCQVRLTRELDGMTATLPAATRNMFVDGKKSAH